MRKGSLLKSGLTVLAITAAAYFGYVGLTFWEYGKTVRREDESSPDPLLDRFMPLYAVYESYQVRVSAPAAATYAAACNWDLQQSRFVRAIFRGRELLLGSRQQPRRSARGLIDDLKALSWSVLAEIPGREIVMGTATQPWLADVQFRSLPPETFLAFHEPGFVKIAFTLRADPVEANESILRTETRVLTTDAAARATFRWYWSFLSPGIILIRRISLREVKEICEKQAKPNGLASASADNIPA